MTNNTYRGSATRQAWTERVAVNAPNLKSAVAYFTAKGYVNVELEMTAR